MLNQFLVKQYGKLTEIPQFQQRATPMQLAMAKACKEKSRSDPKQKG